MKEDKRTRKKSRLGSRASTRLSGHIDASPADRLRKLTEDWGHSGKVALYLDRCQVDTPDRVVDSVWEHIRQRRSRVQKVLDFGAGDGRFARTGSYGRYVGYEIDVARCGAAALPPKATLINRCAFADTIEDADVCTGNPPYVRNQDLPEGWRQRAASVVRERTGVEISGLANAWQYFALLSLASTKPDGLVALVMPYEWVSRPSAKAFREYISSHNWSVSTYRLRDETFSRVLTTASITVIDKRDRSGKWRFYLEDADSRCLELPSPASSKSGVLDYARRSEAAGGVRVKRGLSPGTQEVLTLTEGERVRAGLKVGTDVVPCVTSLRHVETGCTNLSAGIFKTRFRDAGVKCWLIRTDTKPSSRLMQYLTSIPANKYQTSTCLDRADWWRFAMPSAPAVLVASSFKGSRPKALVNRIDARAIGSVSGVYGIAKRKSAALVAALSGLRIDSRLVPYSNGLLKIEVGQFNTILRKLLAERSAPIQ